MPYRWPTDTDFVPWELDVLDRHCSTCGRRMHICDHRFRHLHTLEGPVELICKLNHCPDPHCPGHTKTKGPEIEATIAPPHWAIGWDVFCWIGHRRFSRHWAIPQIRAELLDAYRIQLSDDAIGQYIHRYQVMLAARQQDAEALLRQYEAVEEIILSIDGLQPEKGHETLYVVRELTQKRVWFAEALISATAAEVRRLIAQAKGWAEALGKPVALWLSDRQDAFVTGIAAEFPGVPHRYCQNHFLRDVAKPVLEADSHTKVRMRKKVRRPAEDRTGRAETTGHRRLWGGRRSGCRSRDGGDHRAGGVAGIAGRSRRCCGARLLRGGARHRQRRSGWTAPTSWLADGPGLGRGSRIDPAQLGREKRGFAEQQLGRLAGCIDRGLNEVEAEQETIRGYVEDVEAVAATLDPGGGSCADRRKEFEELIDRFEQGEDAIRQKMARVMISFLAGLFVGEGRFEEIKDDLDLER